MRISAVMVALLASLLLAPAAVRAQGVAPPEAPRVAPLPKECETPGAAGVGQSPLPNVSAALKARKKITILAIGGTSSSMRGAVSGGHYKLVQRFLETSFKGLDVEIVHRGVSGELAADAAERIKTEVALADADLVLWQLGTADVMARLPVLEVAETVQQTLAWLKDHRIDVILIGLRYARSMTRDVHYQSMRAAIQQVAKDQNILRIGRYEAEETYEKIRQSRGAQMSEVEVSEASYSCMAEFVARAIATGLFLANTPGQPRPRQP